MIDSHQTSLRIITPKIINFSKLCIEILVITIAYDKILPLMGEYGDSNPLFPVVALQLVTLSVAVVFKGSFARGLLIYIILCAIDLTVSNGTDVPVWYYFLGMLTRIIGYFVGSILRWCVWNSKDGTTMIRYLFKLFPA